MVKIRLRRVGAKKQPSYRIVVAEVSFARGGRFIENIGHYNPLTNPASIKVDEERALYWLRHGAQPTPAVAKVLTDMGVMARLAPAADAPAGTAAA